VDPSAEETLNEVRKACQDSEKGRTRLEIHTRCSVSQSEASDQQLRISHQINLIYNRPHKTLNRNSNPTRREKLGVGSGRGPKWGQSQLTAPTPKTQSDFRMEKKGSKWESEFRRRIERNGSNLIKSSAHTSKFWQERRRERRGIR